MAASAKKKREKKQDFQKAKLKVGRARPKNTNATDTSFSARSIHLQQQTLSSASTRDAPAHFRRNLSLLTGTESQKKDALSALTSSILQSTPHPSSLPVAPSQILSKSQPLLFDPSASVRAGHLRLLRALPADELGDLTDFLLWSRAGLSNLSADVRMSSLDAMDWLLDARGARVLGVAPGGWVKTLRTFQNLLGWEGPSGAGDAAAVGSEGKWTAAPKGAAGSGRIGSGSKLWVRQMSVLARVLTAGLERGEQGEQGVSGMGLARGGFPLWRREAHALPSRSRAYGYLNLFGAPRDVESEVYDDPEERAEVFVELGMDIAFELGVREAKKEGGEVGRAAAMVDKALRLVGEVG